MWHIGIDQEAFLQKISTAWVMVSLIGVGSVLYLVGRIDAQEASQQASITINYPQEAAEIDLSPESQVASQSLVEPSVPTGQIVASKNGTRYYTPGCSGINRIKPENIISFETPEEAQAQGLTIAKACQ